MPSVEIVPTMTGKFKKFQFVAAIFAGSFLLFLVQPMIARMALPRLGGAPAVWNSAMLVYQMLLLGGYAYAHFIGRLAPRTQGWLQIVFLAGASLLLPIGLVSGNLPPDSNILLWVPWLLFISIGPLFLAVSAQAPLLQRWFALTGRGDPYPLYAASNLGSFGGLIAYPLVVEPFLSVGVQSILWSFGYGFVLLATLWCVLALPTKSPVASSAPQTSAPPVSDVIFWIALAAIPSGLMLSTTLHITTDVVAMPMLWVLPLGLYLLSFSVAFMLQRRPTVWVSKLAPFALLAAAGGLWFHFSLATSLAVATLNLFILSVALHGTLYDRRPSVTHLTAFYLCLAIGGALGGVFNALIAPLIFDWTYEHLIWLAAAAFALSTRSPFSRYVSMWDGDRIAVFLTRWGVPAVLLLSAVGQGFDGLPLQDGDWRASAAIALTTIAIVAIGNRVLFTTAIVGVMLSFGGWGKLALSAEPGAMSRSFFGVYSISPGPEDSRQLIHGTTLHGVQLLGSEERQRIPTSYYAAKSGVGLALAGASRIFGENAHIGIVGLGTGTVACYARPGQIWSFFEIDPLVVEIAKDQSQFTFLSSCNPRSRISVGDARLTLTDSAPGSFDILAIDAFSSDSIPMHLLTKEAFATYRRALKSDGLLLVHISNRHLDLRPVIASAAREVWVTRSRSYSPSPRDAALLQATPSLWIALSPDPKTIASLEALSGSAKWGQLKDESNFVPWTDDYGSILPTLKALQ